MNFFVLAVVAMMLSGCASNGIADYRGFGVNSERVTEPTSSNNYRGVLVEKSPVAAEALESRAAEICSSRGGLKISPRYTNTAPIGWKFYEFRCNGPAPISSQPQQQIAPTPQTQNQVGMEIGEAKSKCTDLGFKTGTEAFGKCVLRLSK